MGSLNLATLTNKSPYIEKIRSALESATGQQVPIGTVDVLKPKRVSGVSAAPVMFNFAGGQILTLYVRASADVFKAELNGKTVVISGDFSDDWKQTFDAAVSSMAKLVRDSQKAIQTQNQKQKVVLPRSTKQSVPQQIKQLQAHTAQLDQIFNDKVAQRDNLKQQLELARQQTQPVA